MKIARHSEMPHNAARADESDPSARHSTHAPVNVVTDWQQERERQRVKTLNWLLWIAVVGGFVPTFSSFRNVILNPREIVVEIQFIAPYLFVIVAFMGRRLDYRLRLSVPVLGIYLSGIVILSWEGVGSYGVWYLLAGPVLLFPLTGWQMGGAASVLSLAIYAYFAVAHSVGWIESRDIPDYLFNATVTYVWLLVIVGVAQGLFNQQRDRALQASSEQTLALMAARAQEQARATDLAQVNARLQRQSWLLNVTADIMGDVAGLDNLDELFEQIANLIYVRFRALDVVHVGLFAQELGASDDDTTVPLVLRAAVGEGAERLRVPPAVTAEALRSAAVASAPSGNGAASATLLEMAIPLKMYLHVAGKNVLHWGALYMCSTDVVALADIDPAVLMVLAGQLAVAVQNVYLLQQARGEVQEMRLLEEQHTTESWRDLFEEAAVFTHGAEADSVAGSKAAVLQQALSESRLVVAEKEAGVPATIVVPIKVRETVLGVLEVQGMPPGDGPPPGGGGGNWSAEQVALVDTVVDQLGVALDSARLYQDSQRRASRERLVDTVSSNIRSSLELDTVLRMAVTELREALQLAEVEVRFGDEAAIAIEVPPQKGEAPPQKEEGDE